MLRSNTVGLMASCLTCRRPVGLARRHCRGPRRPPRGAFPPGGEFPAGRRPWLALAWSGRWRRRFGVFVILADASDGRIARRRVGHHAFGMLGERFFTRPVLQQNVRLRPQGTAEDFEL